MNYNLIVTIELSWRANILDMVSPVASFDLLESKYSQGIFNLEHIQSPSFLLTTGEKVSLSIRWCARDGFQFILTQQNKTLIHLQTEKPFYLEVYLPDNKFYQFRIDDAISN